MNGGLFYLTPDRAACLLAAAALTAIVFVQGGPARAG
jgi:hypothetical protein